jgi:hypothetical protein
MIALCLRDATLGLAVIAWSALARPLFAGAAADPLPTADQVVARHVQARGGSEKIRNLRTVIYRGLYRERDDATSHEAAMALMRPYYKLVGDPDRLSMEFREGYDGSAWEFYGDPGIVLRTVGAAAAAARHGLAIDGPLADYRQKGTTITVQGVEPIGGRKAYRLLVRMQDGFEEQEFIDAETWLLIATRKVAPIHAFGKAIASETRFGDFQPVEGVLFAHSDQEVEIATGVVLNEMKWVSITVNRDLDPALFSPPVFEHTPLQQLLEQLFAEQSDVEAVLWSYRGFRRAHPDAETDVEMQVIGYQMLKMGDHPAALALLKANTADYPRSSAAAFALARAYKTSGNQTQARVQFQRALDLDPGNKRARDALHDLPK